MLDTMLTVFWTAGHFSDVPGCKLPPNDKLYEFFIRSAGRPFNDFNFSAQAGYHNGAPFASSAIFNNKTQRYEWNCGGLTTKEIAEPCTRILKEFISRLNRERPDWNHCGKKSNEPRTMYIALPPPFWQTKEFIIAVSIMLICLGYLISFIICRNKTQQKNQLVVNRLCSLRSMQHWRRSANESPPKCTMISDPA
jgi:hypothetical protein